MYRVFILSTVHGYAHAEVRRNGEFLTSARGVTTAQALRVLKRSVRIARHAGEFAPDQWADSEEFERTTYNSETHKPGNTRVELASEYGPANPAPERWESDENGNSSEDHGALLGSNAPRMW